MIPETIVVAQFFAVILFICSVGFGVYWIKKSKYAWVHDNRKYYKIRKDEDDDCPSY